MQGEGVTARVRCLTHRGPTQPPYLAPPLLRIAVTSKGPGGGGGAASKAGPGGLKLAGGRQGCHGWAILTLYTSPSLGSSSRSDVYPPSRGPPLLWTA